MSMNINPVKNGGVITRSNILPFLAGIIVRSGIDLGIEEVNATQIRIHGIAQMQAQGHEINRYIVQERLP